MWTDDLSLQSRHNERDGFSNTCVSIVYSTVYSGTDQRKHQSSASLAFVRGIHRWAVNSPHKGPVAWKMFPFGDVIMWFDSCAEFIHYSCMPTGKFYLHSIIPQSKLWNLNIYRGITRFELRNTIISFGRCSSSSMKLSCIVHQEIFTIVFGCVWLWFGTGRFYPYA